MNPVWGHVAGVVTVILMITFIGIWIWAWNKRHAKVFERMARVPLDEDECMPPHDDGDPHGEHSR